jgi:hypothetical protein
MKPAQVIVVLLISIPLAFAGGIATEKSSAEQTANFMIQSSQMVQDNQARALESWQKSSAAYLERAQSCEAKFRIGTVMFEPRPLGSVSFMHGAASLDVGNGMQMTGTWFVPVQIEAHSTIPGAQYKWIDGPTGVVKGTFIALPAGPGVQPQPNQ